MKIVVCLECADWFSPGKDKVKRCECGYTLAKWKDPERGILHVASRWATDHLRVVGINNAMLYASVEHPSWGHYQWKEFVNSPAMKSSPGYLFDEQLRDCPIVFILPSDSGDVIWNPELLDEVPWYGKFDCAKPAEG